MSRENCVTFYAWRRQSRVIIKLFIQSQWTDRDSRNGIIDQDRRGTGSSVPNPLPVHVPSVFPWTGITEHAGVVYFYPLIKPKSVTEGDNHADDGLVNWLDNDWDWDLLLCLY